MKKNILFVFLLILTFFKSYAQDSSKVSKFHFIVGLNFTTVPTLNVSGVDTTFNNSLSASPVFTVSYNGFSAIYSPKFVMGGSNSGIYMHAISAEYAQYDKPKVDFDLEYTYMFFTGNSSVPYTPLNNEVYSAITFKKAWIRSEFAAGLGFGSTKATSTNTAGSAYDFGLSAGIGHSFEWNNSIASYNLIPSILVNGGTNQYFSYLKISRYISSNKKFGNFTKKGLGANRGNGQNKGGSTTSTSTSLSGESFNISNVEVNLEASAEMGSFTARPTVSMYLPVGTAAGSGITAFWQIALQYEF